MLGLYARIMQHSYIMAKKLLMVSFTFKVTVCGIHYKVMGRHSLKNKTEYRKKKTVKLKRASTNKQ